MNIHSYSNCFYIKNKQFFENGIMRDILRAAHSDEH